MQYSRSQYFQSMKRHPISILLAVVLSVLTICLFVFGNKTIRQAEATEYVVADYRQQFINTIAPSAQQLANAYDLYPSVMIAQAIHESNYGQSGLSISPYNNLFGIKGAYNGQSVSLQTWEDDGYGNTYDIVDYFRTYPSYYESLADYVNIVRQPYFNSVWRSNTSSYLDATYALTGTYATDTAYAEKLNDIIELHGLTQYDGYYTNENVSSVANLIWNPYRAQYTTQETLNLDIAWANR